MSKDLATIVKNSIEADVVVEGPIAVTETSHPFSAMDYAREPLDIAAYGYVEEEYFVSGTANVYEETDVEMKIKHEDQSYKNRIFVRKPSDTTKFSGRVFMDIYNASNGYDIEDVWRRSYEYYMNNGDIYVGVTAKPINVLSLKNFDFERYQSLNWSAADPAPQPATTNANMSIPGTEEGLVWDILSQLGTIIRKNKASFLKDYPVDYLYLTGQSQSGMYLNTYTYYFDQYLVDSEGKTIFDGYLNAVGAGVMRSLNQMDDETQPFATRLQKHRPLNAPIIFLSAHGDIELFGAFETSTNALIEKNLEDKTRHYEVASSPHTDPASPLIPNNSEIVKTNHPPKILDGEYNYTVNDIQLSYYINSALEMLHQWAAKGTLPPASSLIERDEKGNVVLDEHGNGVGGVRSPYIDVPLATYHANARTTADQVNQTVGNVNGSMEYFSKDKLMELYQSKEDYLERFNKVVEKQVEDKLLIPFDAESMKEWAKETIHKIY